MKQETSQWGKAVKKAVIDHDMTLKQLAEKIGYSNATVSQVVNGRYFNSSYKVSLLMYSSYCHLLPCFVYRQLHRCIERRVAVLHLIK